MRSIVYEDNRNSRRYWIYTLIITIYCMNKKGFPCALLRAVFSLILFFLYPHSFLFFSSILSRLLTHLFCFFTLYICRSRTSRLLVSLLHHYTTRINWELPLESASLIYLTRIFQKKLHYNLLIQLFKACFTPHENMHWTPSEFCLFFVALTSKWPRVG